MFSLGSTHILMKAGISMKHCIFKLKREVSEVLKISLFGDPGGIRTHDPQLRRLLLYPAELLDQSYVFNSPPLKTLAKVSKSFKFSKCKNGFQRKKSKLAD